MGERHISEAIFWKIVEIIGWGKSTDHQKLGEKLLYFVKNVNEIDTLTRIAIQKRETLKDVINAYRKTYNDLPHYWGGDDSFWDFRAHIVGLGEETYNKCLLDIKNISVAKDYKENFEYLFRRATIFAETDEGKELLKLPLDVKELMYDRKYKLERILK